MSPTEFDLRAALRDGEGDELDAGRVLAGARAYRARRRGRILSTAATVVCVAAVGGVVAGLVGTSGGGHESGGTANVAGPAVGTAGPATRGSSAPMIGTQGTTGDEPGCPPTQPSTEPPSGTPSNALLPQPVRSFVVCSYGSPQRAASGGAPVRLVITGSDATALAGSLRTAAAHPLGIVCPDITGTEAYALAIIGVTGSGRTLPAVTTTLTLPACNVIVTNGSAVRYGWRPPQDLVERLTALSAVPGTGPAQRPDTSIPPARNSGSPVR